MCLKQNSSTPSDVGALAYETHVAIRQFVYHILPGLSVRENSLTWWINQESRHSYLIYLFKKVSDPDWY